jgi:hypothetical protein
MTRLAREIPTDPAHPIKESGTYKDKHTPLTEKQRTKRERENLHRKEHSIHSSSRIILIIQTPLEDQRKTENKQ